MVNIPQDKTTPPAQPPASTDPPPGPPPLSPTEPAPPPPPPIPPLSSPAEPAPPPPTTSEPPFPISLTDSSQPAFPPAQPTSEVVPPPPPPPPTKSGPTPGKPAEVVEPLFKRFLPIIIGVIILILIALLFSKLILPKLQKPKQPTSITLKYWGLWEPENIIAQIIKDYQTDHPNVSIQYTRQSPKDYRERLQSALARNDGPDIFRWHNTWLPMLRADLDPVPDNIYAPGDFATIFYPIVKQDVFSANKYHGIPLEFDALALYVNEDIFAANLNLKVPTTWDNLRQTAFKLKQTDPVTNKLTQAGVALGTTSNIDNFSDILGLMILQNGGDPSQPDTEAVTSALKFYTLFTTQDKSWSEDLPNSTYAFATEKVAMIIAPSWRASEIKQLNPQLNFKLYPVPQLPGTNITWATYWIEGVSRKSAQPQAAWEFLKYLSSKDTLTKMYNLASQTRLFGEPYPRQDMAPNLQQDPFVGAILSQALAAKSWPMASRTFDNGLNDRIIKYYQDAVNSYHQNLSEETITQALSQGVSQVLSQYGLTGQ